MELAKFGSIWLRNLAKDKYVMQMIQTAQFAFGQVSKNES
jgi:hypothetical protein